MTGTTTADEGAPNWAAANQARLVAELAHLKAILRPSHNAGAPASTRSASRESAAGDQAAFAERPFALDHLAQAFDLSKFERQLLLLCAAPELDQEFAALCAAAQGDAARTRPTFGLALATLPDAHWSALAPNGALRQWRLIELVPGAMLTSAALQIDERILHFLLGIDQLDARLAHLIRELPPTHSRALAPSHAGIVRDVAALWSSRTAARSMPLVQLCGDPDDCFPIVAAAAAECSLRAARIGAEHALMAGHELDAFLRLWEREFALSGLGVLVIEREDTRAGAEDGRTGTGASPPLLERAAGRVVLMSRQRATLSARAALTIDVPHPTTAEQRLLWRSALRLPIEVTARGVEEQLDALGAQFSLSAKAIRAIAADAVSLAPADALPAAWGVCRMFLRDRMEGLAQRIATHARWPELVLPTAETEVLHAIVAQVRQRRIVYETWGFAEKSARGLGTSVLFAGPSGTGKTLAAEVLANEMRLDLYRIDLSAIFSKYIGESEKALRRVFDAAEDSGAILLVR